MCHLQGLLDGVAMYAFYSLLVYIFYTVFKKEEEDEALEGACGSSSNVCLATSCLTSGVLREEKSFLFQGTCLRHLYPPTVQKGSVIEHVYICVFIFFAHFVDFCGCNM